MNAAMVTQPTRAIGLGSDSSVLMRMIETAMAREDFNIEKLEKLLSVKQQWEANEARKYFVEAMSAFKSEPIVIEKRKFVGYDTKEGDKVGYWHAELSDVTEVVCPILAKHGLSHRWDVKQENGRVIVSCILTHALGHSECVTMDAAPDGSGKKNPVQQIASAMTYLQRYTLMALCGLAARGADDDGQGAGSPSQIQDDGISALLYDKISLAETTPELQKIKPDIEAATVEAGTKRNLISAYNKKLRELRDGAQQ